MAMILKSNSARIALRSITQSLAVASTTTTNHSSSLTTYRLSSVRFYQMSLDNRTYIITPPLNWGVVGVPFARVFVIERYGKYFKTLPAGRHYLVPFVDRIAYVHFLLEDYIKIPAHHVTTKDNVTILIEGLLCVKIVDPKLASYGVENPLYAVIQVAQNAALSELSKIILDKFFMERKTLYEKIVESINVAVKSWGLRCLRYSNLPTRMHLHTEEGAISGEGILSRKSCLRCGST